MHLYSTGSGARYDRAESRAGDTLVFGCETKGLPQEILDAWPGNVLGIPMMTEHVRSLNLSTAVGIVVYHALHELDGEARRGEEGGTGAARPDGDRGEEKGAENVSTNGEGCGKMGNGIHP